MSSHPEKDAVERSEPTALSGLATSTCSLPEIVQTAFIFAARYVHHRDTGGTLAVCKALAYVWPQLSEQTREQILRKATKRPPTSASGENFAAMKERTAKNRRSRRLSPDSTCS